MLGDERPESITLRPAFLLWGLGEPSPPRDAAGKVAGLARCPRQKGCGPADRRVSLCCPRVPGDVDQAHSQGKWGLTQCGVRANGLAKQRQMAIAVTSLAISVCSALPRASPVSSCHLTLPSPLCPSGRSQAQRNYPAGKGAVLLLSKHNCHAPVGYSGGEEAFRTLWRRYGPLALDEKQSYFY